MPGSVVSPPAEQIPRDTDDDSNLLAPAVRRLLSFCQVCAVSTRTLVTNSC
jgi:hypothetical protein